MRALDELLAEVKRQHPEESHAEHQARAAHRHKHLNRFQWPEITLKHYLAAIIVLLFMLCLLSAKQAFGQVDGLQLQDSAGTVQRQWTGGMAKLKFGNNMTIACAGSPVVCTIASTGGAGAAPPTCVNQVVTGNGTIFSCTSIDWTGSVITNKPTIPSALSALTDDSTHRLTTDAEKTAWNGKEAGGAVATHASLTTGVHGAGVNAFIYSNDSRLTDARTPTAHTHVPADVTGTAVITTDARLSDARTPTAHNQAETTLTITDITTNNATTLLHGFLPKLGGGSTNFLRADGTWNAPPAGAPTTSTYIVQTADAGLSAEQALSALTTGIVKVTNGTGVLTTAIAGDFPTLNQSTSGTAANLSGTPTLPNGTLATTQTAADNSTKLATTAYADTGFALSPKNYEVASDWSTTSTTFSNITGLGWAIGASAGQTFTCYLGVQDATTTVGTVLGFTGPASPTLVTLLATLELTAAGTVTYQEASAASFPTSIPTTACSASCVVAFKIWKLEGVIKNGVNAGTVQLQAKVASGTGKIAAASACWVH